MKKSTLSVSSEPCQPAQLTVTGSCDNNTVHLNWNNSRGASRYTVLITSNLGYTESLQTSVPMLTVDLLCGQTYTFKTVGENDICDSLPSTPANFRTGMNQHS